MVQPQQALAAQQQFAPQQTLPQQQFATQQTFPQQQVNPQLQMYGQPSNVPMQNQIMPAPGYAPMMMQAAPEKKKKRRVTFGSKSVLTECSDCEEEVDTTVKGNCTNNEICCMIILILIFWPATPLIICWFIACAERNYTHLCPKCQGVCAKVVARPNDHDK